ncbi:shikimate dehydrogenase [Bacillus sp. DTU_2020_1000418_1_SI_GHA_SEK_038]|uniref:shikimate dehydrogenase n=1 Tax=Bacillus sp. DTU_2020_1000418_1_SI_GHA_SEK_038 TaxID=3077585 RepID=UPI0028E7B2D2|nr:shikimate dehydrogenase [Bacillus sp. DTU_2020_1000418_1_SI_GHA_SEK_038]WNS74372.1 shikimate dehydrogenase [Bacillus sp. DTU_2020_1000418_1_SI_GHA_SEK_038]
MKKFFAVIGDPIAHSMSPAMHNDLFQAYGIDAHYQPLHVKREDLADAIKGLKAIGISGFNVTVPHKETIIPLLDELDPLAQSIGAVNTVVNLEGKLIGYNTDGSGYVKGLQEEMPNLKDKKVLVIGAGGAARAIYFTIAAAGAEKLDICNRTVSKAAIIKNECPYYVNSDVYDIRNAEENLELYDLVIQTTPAGMAPKIQDLPLSLHNLKEGALASDIIYNPLETIFLKEAKNKGASIQNGLNMFVYQGALAFEKWTGTFPDTNRMRDIVLSQLGG